MVGKIAIPVLFFLIVLFPAALHAQVLLSHKLFGLIETSEDLEYRLIQAQKWTEDMDKWLKWASVWLNYYGPILSEGKDGRTDIRIEKRRLKPTPPIWLSEECNRQERVGVWAKACERYALWQEDLILSALRAQKQTAAAKEVSNKSRFTTYFHFDSLWFAPQGGPQIIAPIGMHLSFAVVDRFEFFSLPGAVLLNVPTEKGRSWQPAYDYGFGYRLTRFRLPIANKPVSLHFNLAKVWLLGGPTSNLDGSITLVGFSLSPK
jgi:hypothetical protein